MFDAIFGQSIRSRVLATVEARIENAEKKFTDGCVEIDNEADRKKEELADALVAEVLAR